MFAATVVSVSQFTCFHSVSYTQLFFLAWPNMALKVWIETLLFSVQIDQITSRKSVQNIEIACQLGRLVAPDIDYAAM